MVHRHGQDGGRYGEANQDVYASEPYASGHRARPRAILALRSIRDMHGTSNPMPCAWPSLLSYALRSDIVLLRLLEFLVRTLNTNGPESVQ